ncbi:hypothetical protein [Nucisporomicrobium flavum]|uniref:hypothetical protein n=1 Tax=Nucisporomicrobium flavum TaxID=2785915 RepID=UPI0018F2DB4F|nr:hypothetical protein [Nucisporomicrobium flavum]
MAVVGYVRDDEYWPEFSTVVVRDGVMAGDDEYVCPPKALDEGGLRIGFGTIGRAGAGWMQLVCTSGPQRVILEVHDQRPPPVGAEWAEAFETPYRSGSASVGLTHMTDGWAQQAVSLPSGEKYRVQVSHRWLQAGGGEWRLRWWPQHRERPPRWLRRANTAERNLKPSQLAADAFAVAAWSPAHEIACTVDQLAQRLLAAPDQTAEAITHAADREWLTFDEALPAGSTIVLRVPDGAEVADPDALLRRRLKRAGCGPGTTVSPVDPGPPDRRNLIGGLSYLMPSQDSQNETPPQSPDEY